MSYCWLIIGGKIKIHCSSWKEASKKCYNYLKEHPSTNTTLDIKSSDKSAFVSRLKIEKRTRIVISYDRIGYHPSLSEYTFLLKSDGTMGRKVYARIDPKTNEYVLYLNPKRK